jgi:Ser/Thr protein kinase RdoA (MazF antagonist)
VPGLVDSWLAGYRRAGQLPAADEAEIWTFIMFRRLLLVAWIGSHRAAGPPPSSAPDTPQTAADWPGRT